MCRFASVRLVRSPVWYYTFKVAISSFLRERNFFWWLHYYIVSRFFLILFLLLFLVRRIYTCNADARRNRTQQRRYCCRMKYCYADVNSIQMYSFNQTAERRRGRPVAPSQVQRLSSTRCLEVRVSSDRKARSTERTYLYSLSEPCNRSAADS